MTKVIIEGVVNNIAIALCAWLLIGGGVLPAVLLAVTLVVFFAYVLVSYYRETGALKGAAKQLFIGAQMRNDTDEREVIITPKATKAAYESCILAWIFGLVCLWLVNIYSVEGILGTAPVDMLAAGVTVLSLAFMVVQSTFFISWCYYYKK